MPKYTAGKDVVVGGLNAKGSPVGPISFSKGTYSTKDPDEVALLDQVADDPSNPVGHADPDKE